MTGFVQSDTAHLVTAFTPVVVIISFTFPRDWSVPKWTVVWVVVAATIIVAWPTSSISAPTDLLKLVRGGPIRSQATDVAAMLTEPGRSQVILVTLPETTPVNEAIETAEALRKDGGMTLGPVVVNAFDEGPDLNLDDVEPDSSLRAAAEFRNARRQLHRRESERLAEALDLPHICLPLVTSAELDADSISELATRLGPS